MDVEDNAKQLLFGWLDFAIFILMLLISTMIGIYFGYWGKKEDTPKEYLLGGKSMNAIPVGVSLVASFISGIFVMGLPAEMYTYGTLYWLICIAIVVVGFITDYIYLPVFYELQLTSVYAYLELRFNRSVRIMASVLYAINTILYIPIVVYVPALAFNQVTGVNLHFITPCISILCIFYTMIGGIKAVVWTDLLQGVLMIFSSIVVIILGVIHIGGFQNIWERNRDAGRILIFEMNPSPFVRLTFWIVVLGHIIHWSGAISLNQACVQKFLSLPSYSKARTALIIFVVELLVLVSLCCFTGLLIFAHYYDCDPVKTKIISRSDQLLPYYVMDTAASIPGLPGLFISGIFSASLSTMSSSLNSLGASLFEDFVRPCLRHRITDKTANNIIKCVIILIGAICVLFVFIVDKLSGIIQLVASTGGITLGTILGLFSFGMFYPRANSKGALAGSISSLLIMGWIVFGTQKAIADGVIHYPTLPTSVEGCKFNFTLSEPPTTPVPQDEVFLLYRLSFMYYSTLGMIIVFVVGTIVSLLTEPPKYENMNPALFAPMMRKFLKSRKEVCNSNGAVENELLNTVSHN